MFISFCPRKQRVKALTVMRRISPGTPPRLPLRQPQESPCSFQGSQETTGGDRRPRANALTRTSPSTRSTPSRAGTTSPTRTPTSDSRFPSQLIVESLPRLWYEAERRLQRDLERDFIAAFFELQRQPTALRLGRPLLAYAASISTMVAATYLMQRKMSVIADRAVLRQPARPAQEPAHPAQPAARGGPGRRPTRSTTTCASG